MPVSMESPTIPIPGSAYIAAGFSARVFSLPNTESVIIKVAKTAGDGRDEERLNLLKNEKDMYCQLGVHSNIPQYYGPYRGAAEDHKTLETAFVLERADGGDLAGYLDSKEPPSEQAKGRMIAGLVDALMYAYEMGVSHQDIKTDNVFIFGGVPKLGDFGLGVAFKDNEKEREEELWMVDALGIGTIIASIARWEAFHWDYYRNERFPREEELPANMSGRAWEGVVWKCLTKGFAGAQELHSEVLRVQRLVESQEEEPISAWRLEGLAGGEEVPGWNADEVSAWNTEGTVGERERRWWRRCRLGAMRRLRLGRLRGWLRRRTVQGAVEDADCVVGVL